MKNKYLVSFCVALGAILFSNLAMAKKELMIYSSFPSHWIKGTWLSEVAKEFEIRNGVSVTIVDYANQVNKKNLFPDLDHTSKKETAFIASQLASEKPNMDLMIAAIDFNYFLGNSFFLLENKHDLSKTMGAQGLELPNDDQRHALIKKKFLDFLGEKDLVDLYPDGSLQVRSNVSYGYLPTLPLSISAAFWVYDKRVAKKLGLDIPEIGFGFDALLGIAQELHAYNSKMPLADKIALYPEFESSLLEHSMQILVKKNGGKVRGEAGEFQPYLKQTLAELDKFTKYDPLVRDRVSDKIKSNPWFGLEPSYKEFLDGKYLFYPMSQANLAKLRQDDRRLYRKLGFTNMPSIVDSELIQVSPENAYWVPKAITADKKKLALDFIRFASQEKFVRSWVKYTGLPHASHVLKGKKSTAAKNYASKLSEAYSDYQSQDQKWDASVKLWECKRKNKDGIEEVSNLYAAHYSTRAFVVPFLWLGTKKSTELVGEIQKHCNLEKMK